MAQAFEGSNPSLCRFIKRCRIVEYSDFEKLDIRIGRIIKIEDFPEAKKPAYKLEIDFGSELGRKRSSAHITNYDKESLIGRTVVAVTNFEPKQVANFMSEVLILGALSNNKIMLLSADESKGRIEPGAKVS